MTVNRLRWPAIMLALGLFLVSSHLGAQESKSTKPKTLQYGNTHWFPTVWEPYASPSVPEPRMTSSQRLQSLIREGKLYLSVDDTLALTLENNLDATVARYQIPLAQADYLRTQGGGAARGISGANVSAALFGGAIGATGGGGGGAGTGGAGGSTGGGGATNVGSVGCCDAFAGMNWGWDRRTSPLNYIILSGAPQVTTQNTSYTAYFGKGFFTGTGFVVAGSGFRQSTTSPTTLFNPVVPVGLTLGFNQHLLAGFGYRANAASLRIARNNLRFADSTFRQQVITTVAQVLNLYYSLLYDRENVLVARKAVEYAEKLLSDNKRQVEIGTLAPIEVVRAESELATDQQALVVAETGYKQQEELLKTAISRQVDAQLAGVEIEPTDKLPEPRSDDIADLQEALREAHQNRPELEQADLNLRNQEITIQAVRNRLLPTLDVFATYAPTGLAGNQRLCIGPPGASGQPTTVPCFVPGGVSQAMTQALHGRYPDYSFGASLSFPIRNRTSQADAATALVQQRQLRAQLQRITNQAEQDVRNAVIAVIQAKAQIEAASKAVVYAQQTLDAEQKKFMLGESTVFLVITAERDLVARQGDQVKARQAYAQAITQYQTATATILKKYNIEMADAVSGEVTRAPNIPGTPAQPAGEKTTAPGQ